MRWIPLLTLALTTLHAGDMNDARITMSYQELQQILAASKVEKPVPPVVAAVISADYTFALQGDNLSGSAVFQIQTFGNGPYLVPLFGQHAKIEAVEPADSVLVTTDGSYAILIEGKTRLKLTVRLLVSANESGTPWQINLPIPTASLNSLELTGLDPAYDIEIANAVLSSTSAGKAHYALGAIDALRLTRKEKPKANAEPVAALPEARVETPAIVRSVVSEMKVVRDGSLLNASTWTIRHDAALNWTLTLPEDSQLLSCCIGGQPAAPLQQDARTLIFPLPAPKDRSDTTIELTYTGRTEAFAPVRGELSLELPATSLLVENLAWSIRIPSPYETVAIQGNVDFLPSEQAGQIRLTRELGRGDAPLAHIFYQKPETTK